MSASSIVPPSGADVSSPIYTVPLVSWSRCSSNFEGEFHRCIKYSYIVSKTHKSGRGETILSTFALYISFATCTPFRPSLLKFPCLRWMNYKLFSSDHGILPVLRREKGRRGKRWGEFKETRERERERNERRKEKESGQESVYM